MTIKQEEVFGVEQEPRVADVPPVAISAEGPTSTAVISGQVDQPAASPWLRSVCGHENPRTLLRSGQNKIRRQMCCEWC